MTAGLAPKQVASIREADAEVNIWTGAIRSGKTVGSLLRWAGHVAEQRNVIGESFVFGKTRESIGRNVFGPLQSRALVGDLARHVHYTPGAPTARVLGDTVHVIGANDKTAEEKVRGLTGKSAYGDELTVLPKAFFAQVIGRMSAPNAKVFGTTNPDNPAHWLRKDYLLREGDPTLGVRSWHFRLEDNPFLSRRFIERQKALHVGLFFRRFILGEWVQADGAVFESFDPSRHVVKTIPPGTVCLGVGIDYGTTNPFAALMLGVTPDGRLIIMREWRHDARAARRQMTDAEYSEALAAWITASQEAPRALVVDPSAASFRVQLHRDAVGNVVPADNEVLDGIREVSSMIATNRLLVHESCTGLLDEIPGYSWDDEKAEKGEDAPVKIDDHSVDAMRYVVRTLRPLWRPMVGPPERYRHLTAA